MEETKYTPSINLDAQKGLIELVGKSYPENTFEFYKPMMDWVEEYFNGNEQFITTINFEIIYFNSSSSKLVFDFFDRIEEMREAGKYTEINWIYDKDNDSALETGEDFKEDFEELNFKLIEK